jgi:hypothetical protein
LQLASSSRSFLKPAELGLRKALFHRWSEEIIEHEGEEEMDGQDAAPDAGDPVDEPLGARQDVDREDEQHDGDEDGEVLQELHPSVSAVTRFALEPLFLGRRLAIACAVV